MDQMKKSPLQCVGVICFRGEEVLLIKRGKPPRLGEWSIPGGQIEPGETEIQAARRELMEETGVSAEIVAKIAHIPAEFDGRSYDLHDYLAIWEGGEPVAADDAADALFADIQTLADTPMWDKTRDIIEAGRVMKKAVSSKAALS